MSQSPVLAVGQAPEPPAFKTLTFEEYRFYQGEPDVRCELFRGKPIPLATPSSLHTNICKFLVYQFQRHFAAHNLALVASTDTGVRTEVDSARIPDVVVCSESLWQQVCARPGAGILDFAEVPLLVVEVVSEDWRQDYVRKRAEYALIDVPEYWIVDPGKQRLWVLINPQSEDGYDRAEFKRGQSLASVQFPDLVLSVDEVLDPPLVETLLKQEQEQLRQLEQRAERLAAKLRELNIDPEQL